jgi:hypothetical protein
MPDLKKILADVVDPAMKLLPSNFDSKEARVMLLAMALQESRFEHRRQLVGSPPKPTGPAKSFWQAEIGGGMVRGVRLHKSTLKIAAEVYKARNVAPNDVDIWNAIENDDVLACALARLLLWTDPNPLPAIGNAEQAWQLYLRVWRPGKPHRASWDALYRQSVVAVQ